MAVSRELERDETTVQDHGEQLQLSEHILILAEKLKKKKKY